MTRSQRAGHDAEDVGELVLDGLLATRPSDRNDQMRDSAGKQSAGDGHQRAREHESSDRGASSGRQHRERNELAYLERSSGAFESLLERGTEAGPGGQTCTRINHRFRKPG